MKKTWREKMIYLIIIVLFAAAGALVGYLGMKSLVQTLPQDAGMLRSLVHFFTPVVLLILAVIFQLILHELGHLVFGLLSGYRFSSFRIFSMVWAKEEGRVRFKRSQIPGALGQCLMEPPEPYRDDFPFVMYNLGGSLFNLLSAVISLGLYFLTRDMRQVPIFFLASALIGLLFAFMNGLPLRVGLVNNDANNVRMARRDPDSRYAFWLVLKTNEYISKGIRPKDMPEHYFEPFHDKIPTDSLQASAQYLLGMRLLDDLRIEQANTFFRELLAQPALPLSPLEIHLIRSERIYCELLLDGVEQARSLLSTEQRKIMKLMKDNASMLRINYTIARFLDKDAAKEQALEKRFLETIEKLSSQPEREGEMELYALARDKTVESAAEGLNT